MATSIFPYPAPRVSNKSGTTTIQFGSYSTNFGQLGSSPGRYANRLFVNAFVGLPYGVYSFNVKEISISLPPGYSTQQVISGSTYTLPTPTFLLEGALFNTPQQEYNDDLYELFNGGIIIPANKSSLYHHNSEGADALMGLNTTTVQPNWKCQYFNLTTGYIPLNLRIINRNPTNNLFITNNPDYWFDEPIPTASGNASWPWKSITNEGVVIDFPANSNRNLINVIITLEYSKIDTLPQNGA